MSHLSLYREFRPRVFSDVAGQDHITSTLANQIRLNRVGHAYLFTGSRGVGKTTCARIFARAINCLAPINGSPCHSCDVCQKLDNASNLDITEIDAASNNGVDDARDLRERVKYPPILGKYKVFIIDEVHMLTGSAFNALLKTLEEPPPHVVFILATTESHKLPATILSRVMRFDFRLIPTAKIEEIISSVYQKSGKEFEIEAVKYIAKLGEGSARDALSIAERCLSISDGILTYAGVLDLLGAAGQDDTRSLANSLLTSDIGGALSTVDRLVKSGKSVGMIAKDLLFYLRDLMVVRAAPSILDLPKAEKDELIAAAKSYSLEQIASLVQIFSAIESELRYSVSARTVIETACVRAVRLAAYDPATIEARLLRLELGQEKLEKSPPIQITQAAPITQMPPQPSIKPLITQAPPVNTQPSSQIGQIPPVNTQSSSQIGQIPPVNTQPAQTPPPSSLQTPAPIPQTSPPPIPQTIEEEKSEWRHSSDSVKSTAATQKEAKNEEGFVECGIAVEVPPFKKEAVVIRPSVELPSARALWGRILTYLRVNTPRQIYQIVAEVGDVRLDGTRLRITCGQDNHLELSSPEIMNALDSAAKALGYNQLTFKPELLHGDIDIDEEISNIKEQIGDTPFEVQE